MSLGYIYALIWGLRLCSQAHVKVFFTCNLEGPIFLTAGGWQGCVTTKMWLLREAELTRLKTVTVTLNSPVLQKAKRTHAISRFRPSQGVDIHLSNWGFAQQWSGWGLGKHRHTHCCHHSGMLTSGRRVALSSVQALKTRLQNSTGSSLQFLHWPDKSPSPCGSPVQTPGAAAG